MHSFDAENRFLSTRHFCSLNVRAVEPVEVPLRGESQRHKGIYLEMLGMTTCETL